MGMPSTKAQDTPDVESTSPHEDWALGPAGASCTSVCGNVGKQCNQTGMRAMSLLGEGIAVASMLGIDTTGFSSSWFSSAFADAPGLWENGGTLYLQFNGASSTCDASVASSQRFCCCGMSCPLDLGKAPGSPLPSCSNAVLSPYFVLVDGTGTSISSKEAGSVESKVPDKLLTSSKQILLKDWPSVPLEGSGDNSASSVCPSDAPYVSGPLSAKTVCQLWSYFLSPNVEGYGACSGTFVGSKDGDLLFVTAAHCVVYLDETLLTIQDSQHPSYVVCDRTDGASAGSFEVVGCSVEGTYQDGNSAASDGAVLLVRPYSGTNLDFAAPMAMASITRDGLYAKRPNYNGGFPFEDSRLVGCTSSNLPNYGKALFYSRRYVPYLFQSNQVVKQMACLSNLIDICYLQVHSGE